MPAEQSLAQSPRDRSPFATWFAPALALALVGCSDGRSADDPEVRYGCVAQADCLQGFNCCAGLCHPSGQIPDSCEAGSDTAGGADGGSSDVDTSATDAADGQVGDTQFDAGAEIFGGQCNLTDWTPCGSGNGCYYQPSAKKTFCNPHGSLAEGATCDKKQPFSCGKAAGDRPLLCDEIDAKCYRTCLCTDAAKLPCPTGEKCYCLEVPATKEKWPDGAGICAK